MMIIYANAYDVTLTPCVRIVRKKRLFYNVNTIARHALMTGTGLGLVGGSLLLEICFRPESPKRVRAAEREM